MFIYSQKVKTDENKAESTSETTIPEEPLKSEDKTSESEKTTESEKMTESDNIESEMKPVSDKPADVPPTQSELEVAKPSSGDQITDDISTKTLPVYVSANDWILGIADLTGELMRFAITRVGRCQDFHYSNVVDII